MARRWLTSKHAPSRREEAIAAVLAQLANADAVRAMLARTQPAQRQLLEVVARYGGRISGDVLAAELGARKLFANRASLPFRESDPTSTLRESGLLLGANSHNGYRRAEFAEMTTPGAVVAQLSPAPPVPWPRRPLAEPVEQPTSRAPEAIALELLAVARACERLPKLGTLTGGGLASTTRRLLEKALPTFADDGGALTVPARIDLAWQLLRGVGVVDETSPILSLHVDRLDVLVARAPVEVSTALARGWLEARHWQDGVGAVTDADRRDEIVRFQFEELRTVRELLAWALSRVAAAPPTWLELEPFLAEFHAAAKRGYPSYGPSLRMSLDFAAAAGRDALPRGDERMKAFWFAAEGELVANMLLVTLVHFGLTERGALSGERWAFRLTAAGREVFGAPEVEPIVVERRGGRALVVQGTFDVLMHADAADLGTRTTLARVATLVADGEHVSRYRLERASIGAAIESGMTASQIKAFFAGASRTPLPEVVSVAIDEWAGADGAIRLRGPGWLLAIGDEIGVLSRSAAVERLRGNKELVPPTAIVATLDERGLVSGGPLDPISEARLSRVAERVPEGFQITRERVRAAAAGGVSLSQIEGWIAQAVKVCPPLFRVRLSHWLTGRTARGRTQEHLFLRVDDEMLEYSVAASAVFQGLGVERLARGFLRVDRARLEEVARELGEIGIVLGDGAGETAALPEARGRRARTRRG